MSTLDTSWWEEAQCQVVRPNMAWFVPSKAPARSDPGVQRALAICATCPVRQQCLDYAVRIEDEHGIFGGTLPQERTHLIEAKRQEEQDD